MSETASLWALFTSSFLAATLLPGGSEAVLYGVLRAHPQSLYAAMAVATLGNTLGGMTSYALGRFIPPGKPLKGIAAMRRYGSPALLFSWVPFIGDPLCVAAGWLRLNVAFSILFMATGKLGRYIVIAVASGSFE
jgi:membrane protein YqaA with SNARE-associated domain